MTSEVLAILFLEFEIPGCGDAVVGVRGIPDRVMIYLLGTYFIIFIHAFLPIFRLLKTAN